MASRVYRQACISANWEGARAPFWRSPLSARPFETMERLPGRDPGDG